MENEKLMRSVAEGSAEAAELSDRIFDHPETGRHEVFASGSLIAVLEREGFTVERGVGGIPTSFRAVWENGSGGPSVGMLCEYDALEGYGHACAHHMQGPAVVLAAKALKDAAGEEPFRLIVYGTPDEEKNDGKILMAKNGCFTDAEMILMTHGGPNTTIDVKSLAQRVYTAEYFGRAAHAALNPEAGRSAVDAMLLTIHGMELLREHVRDDVRLHYAILETSPTSNVVPEYAKIEYSLRSYSYEYLRKVCERFEKVMQGAAIMTETEERYTYQPDCMSKVPVKTLNDRILFYGERFDAPQRIAARERTGSTDFGNVLHTVPGACVRVAMVPEGTPSHSEAYLKAGKSAGLHSAIVLAAKILASVVRDYITDEGFREAIRADFSKALQEESKL